jgi:hypothetical protein
MLPAGAVLAIAALVLARGEADDDGESERHDGEESG